MHPAVFWFAIRTDGDRHGVTPTRSHTVTAAEQSRHDRAGVTTRSGPPLPQRIAG